MWNIRMPLDTRHFIVLFDGECAFCARQVAWIASKDLHNRFRFAARLSDEGRAVLRMCGIEGEGPESMIFANYTERWTARSRSDAVIAVAVNLGMPWKFASIARVIPSCIRDSIYNVVARFRRKLGGSTCAMPTEAVRTRLLTIQDLESSNT